MFRLAIAMLPLALGAAAAGVGAQEPAGQGAGARSGGQREAQSAQPGRAMPVAPRQQDAGAEPRRQQDGRQISEAVRRVQRHTRGQILGAEQIPFEGRSITRVKYMDDRGRVRYMDDPGAERRAAPPRSDNDER